MVTAFVVPLGRVPISSSRPASSGRSTRRPKARCLRHGRAWLAAQDWAAFARRRAGLFAVPEEPQDTLASRRRGPA